MTTHWESKLCLSTNKHLKVITLVKVITNLDAIRELQHSLDILFFSDTK